tara:strand:- start:286 stop:468 length:183 start_codon:yes stop_codon:yes gene_type:complete
MFKTTEELRQTLQQLVAAYNNSIEKQQQYKEQIIAINAVIQDRELQNGNTDDTAPESTKD